MNRSRSLPPNGKLVALIAPVKQRNALVIWELEGKDRSRVIPTGEFEPQWFVWKSDRRLFSPELSYAIYTFGRANSTGPCRDRQNALARVRIRQVSGMAGSAIRREILDGIQFRLD